LKGLFSNTRSGKWVQHSLIVFQFAISAFLIVSTVVVQKQLHFIRDKKLGYDREHVLVLPMNQRMLKDLSTLKQKLKSNHDIFGVSTTNSTPVKIAGGYNMRSGVGITQDISVTANPIDEDYIKTSGLEVIYGSDLTEQDMKDVTAENRNDRIYHFILNESATRQLGWTPETAVGKQMFMGDRAGVVKGVIRDFHFESLHKPIQPLVLFSEIRARLLLVKVSGRNLPGTISFIEDQWKSLVPYMPFEYRFLDDDYMNLYSAELQLGTVMNIFAGIAIILACLGLFGLSAYAVQQRAKEISIRKILGASLLSIVSLLSMNFTRLVLISILISLPAAYMSVYHWLKGFAYQVDIAWWIFAIPALLAVAIAFMTVSIQSIKAAVTNPVKNLRSE
jgi:putative ABC transport system permease protein